MHIAIHDIYSVYNTQYFIKKTLCTLKINLWPDIHIFQQKKNQKLDNFLMSEAKTGPQQHFAALSYSLCNGKNYIVYIHLPSTSQR